MTIKKKLQRELSSKLKKVGFFSFTCCEGCVVTFLEVLNKKYDEYAQKMKIENCRQIKPSNKINQLDLAFVEGAISTKSEIRKLKEIRKKSKKVIALGSGAVNGYPSNQRNKFNVKKKKEIKKLVEKFHQIRQISPIKKFIRVDDNILGCPVDEQELAKKIDGYLKNA